MRLATLIAGLFLLACSETEQPKTADPKPDDAKPAAFAGTPVVLIGLDGVSPLVVEKMWQDGELQNLERLKKEGTYSTLKTGYQAKSPVVWTTVATGKTPSEHGIDNFVQDSAGKQIPVSSDSRRVKAIWNITSTAGIPTLVAGWWASWPAEAINGVMVTDRYGKPGVDARYAWPKELEPKVAEWATAAETYEKWFPAKEFAAGDDRLVTFVSKNQLENGAFGLSMSYIHRVDLVSHQFWKYFDTDNYDPISDEDMAKDGKTFFDAYRAVDAAVGEIVAAAPENANVLVISDHGFEAIGESTKVNSNIAALLREAGLWKGSKKSVDWANTQAYVHATPNMRTRKLIRVNLQGREDNGIVAPADKDKVLAQVKTELSKVTYVGSGKKMFSFPAPNPKEDCDMVAAVSQDGASELVAYNNKELNNVVFDVHINTGGHGSEPPGIFLASGPDFAQGATLKDPSIFDITPTILHALGQPVADDMSGRTLTELFTTEHQAANKVTTVPSYETGDKRGGEATASAADEEILEGLRAVGYIE